MMTVEKIRDLRLAEPFKPFHLIMADGRDLPVERPSYLGISPNGRRLAYAAILGGFEFLPVEDVKEAVVDEKLNRFRRPPR